ncbi:hypothetical protein CN984_25755 [Bacillus cereus]|uniref:Uncharacterized protein n=1 Tax=Bacillus cereus TaxID=1396 RepID=A0A2B9PKJ3_BACCE|nr:hypothetical protein CN984_25755 [Bacillus cereus]
MRPYTCTDCSLKTEDMRFSKSNRCNRQILNAPSSHACRSCENQAKVGSVMSQRTRHFSSYRRNYGQRLLR